MTLALSELQPFARHPYKVRNDDAMREMVESIMQYGVLSPAIARPMQDGGYELISGHRRKRACELAGLDAMPVIVRELDDDAAAILVVDSNLQREDLLPSERAFAYKLKLEALRHQGERTDLTSSQVGMKLQALDIVGQEAGDSRNQVHRYIRLTELIPPLLDLVDERKIAFNPAYELSFLTKDEQELLLDAMDSEQATPSLSQAQRLKQFSQRGELDAAVMRAIMSEEKKENERVTLKGDTLRKYFPASYTPKRMEETIIKLLEQWQKQQNTFYLVIDHSTGDVYFLNLVDEADLLALLEDEGYEVECNCAVKCAPGEVDTDCPVCRTDLNECTGAEPEPTPEPTEAPVTEPQEDNDNGFNATALLPIALIVVLGAGGAYYFLKVRKRKPDTSGTTDLDDYDFPEDDDEEVK